MQFQHSNAQEADFPKKTQLGKDRSDISCRNSSFKLHKAQQQYRFGQIVAYLPYLSFEGGL